MTNPVLEYRKVSKTYPGAKRSAVNAVDLAVTPGEILALVGESGSGKTTLLRLAAGLETPDAGAVAIDGSIVADHTHWTPPEKRGVGLVFQDGALFPHLTAARNVAYGLKGMTKGERDAVVRDTLGLVGLADHHSRYPHQLSGGERQRLAVARALAPKPSVVFFDEPFSNLDSALRRSIRDDVRTILKQLGTTAILVTHDTDDSLAIGDRVAVLHQGELVQVDTPAAIYHRPANGYCARLFGPANAVKFGGDTRWVRPEDMTLVDHAADGAIAATVQSLHDAGKHRDVHLKPDQMYAAEADARWLVYVPSSISVAHGDRCWVTIAPRD